MKTSNKYSTPDTPENLYYEGSSILINKLNINDDVLLQEVEKQMLELTVEHYANALDKIDHFDSALLNEVHKNFLSKLYIWAGQYRTVSILKGITHFAMPKYIPALMKKFDKEMIKDGYLLRLDEESFLEKLAYYKCELIAIHPYREGNGRTIRLFCDLIAMKKGYNPFDYSFADDNALISRYIKASEEGVIKANPKPMQEILRECFRK
ncbi:MAG: Fic family protein [Candidatus Margulisiibacteriota bacterium]